jgi:hypothetical protein
VEDRREIWLVSVGFLSLLLSGAVRADTIVMRDGRRVDGDLVAVREGVVEFEGRRGFFGGRERMRIDRGDVRSIELSDTGNRYDRDDRDSRNGDSRGGRPSGMREREVSVDSWIAWKDTGVDVRSGQTIYFDASGRVRWGPNRQDGPEGERNSPHNPSRPIPNRPAAGLIGRVGESGDYFFIGDDHESIRMRSSGRLYLGVNDDYLKDNSGSFRVTVYY